MPLSHPTFDPFDSDFFSLKNEKKMKNEKMADSRFGPKIFLTHFLHFLYLFNDRLTRERPLCLLFTMITAAAPQWPENVETENF
jgi:hypothetical protein